MSHKTKPVATRVTTVTTSIVAAMLYIYACAFIPGIQFRTVIPAHASHHLQDLMSTNIFPANRASYPDPSGRSSILIEYDLFENLLITIMPLNEAPEVYSLLTFEDDHHGLVVFDCMKMNE